MYNMGMKRKTWALDQLSSSLRKAQHPYYQVCVIYLSWLAYRHMVLQLTF